MSENQIVTAWPAAFQDELDAISADALGLLMTPHTLHGLQERIAYAIGAAQRAGELGDWVQVGSCYLGGDQWALTVVDGIDRPSLTIIVGREGPLAPSPADRPVSQNKPRPTD